MKLLLHTCCAPCAISCVDTLRKEGIEPTLFFVNPNIHPYMEYERRLTTLREWAKAENLSLLEQGGYGLPSFLEQISDFEPPARCICCYRLRMDKTALFAKENGFTHISTTLLISPYQNHEGIIAEGKKATEALGLDFLVRDFRPYFREGQEKAKELGLYRQAYCGCIFSEEERYRKRAKRLEQGV